MLGPEILARSLSADRNASDPKYRWPRNREALVAGWTLLFDLLRDEEALSLAAVEGRLGLQLGVTLCRPVMARFDLALTAVPDWCYAAARGPAFHQWADRLGIVLDERDRTALRNLEEVPTDPLGARAVRLLLVQVFCRLRGAGRDLPRLHGALLSAGAVARRQPGRALSTGYVIVGVVDRAANLDGTTSHDPLASLFDAQHVIRGLSAGLPVVSGEQGAGHDATAVTVVRSSPESRTIDLCDDRRALPDIDSPVQYERVLRRLGSAFAARFPLDAPVWAEVRHP